MISNRTDASVSFQSPVLRPLAHFGTNMQKLNPVSNNQNHETHITC